MYMYTETAVKTCTHALTHVQVHAHAHAHALAHICMYTCTCTYMYTSIIKFNTHVYIMHLDMHIMDFTSVAESKIEACIVNFTLNHFDQHYLTI